MRILFLVQQSQRRGAEVFALDLANELRTRGHTVRTVYLYPSGGEPLPMHPTDLELEASRFHFAERFPGVQLSVVKQLARVVQEFQPDIVQANGARALKYGGALKAVCSVQGARFSFVYRSIGDPEVWVQGRLRRYLFRNVIIPQVDGVAAVSRQTLDGLGRLYRMGSKTARVIPRGIDRERLAASESPSAVRSRLDLSPSDRLILFIGSLSPEKRPDRLARVFAGIVEQIPEVVLCVVGEGSERENFNRDIEAHEVADKVRFAGVTGDVGTYYSVSDLLLLTSDTEGLPGVILEAAACGLPVVATDVGGVGDAVQSGTNGLLADAGDEPELVRHCLSVLRDQDLAERLGAAARATFEEKFSISTVADSYEQLYSSVAPQ